MEGMIVLAVLAMIAFPIISLVVAIGARSNVNELGERLKQLESRIASGGTVKSPPPKPPPPKITLSELAVPDLPFKAVTEPKPVAAKSPPTKPSPKPPPAPPSPPIHIDWEKFVGVKMFSWVAAIALVLGCGFFIGYSIDQGWITPPIRLAMGMALGVILIVLCEFPFVRKYEQTANALDASAIAILFATTYAAHALWHVIESQVMTFAVMILITVVAVLLSVRRKSLFISLLGLVGGFVTPVLLSTGEVQPMSLFGYLLFLNIGLAWVARRMRWPILSGISLVATVIYQASWVLKFMSVTQLPLAIGIFLVFPVAFFLVFGLKGGFRKSESAPAEGAPAEGAPAESAMFANIARAATIVPAIFTIYMAAIPEYGANYWLYFGMLLCMAMGFDAVGRWLGPLGIAHFGRIITVVGFVIWFSFSYVAAWPELAVIAAVFLYAHLLMAFVAGRCGWMDLPSPLSGRDMAAVFLFVFPVLVVMEPATAAPLSMFGVLALVALPACLLMVRSSAFSAYFISSAAIIVSEFLWMHYYLDAAVGLPMLMVLLLSTFFFLIMATFGKRISRIGGAGEVFDQWTWFALSGPALLLWFGTNPILLQDPAPFLATLAIMTTAILISAWRARMDFLATGTVLAAFVNLAFWSSGLSAPWPLTALGVTVAATLLILISFWFLRATMVDNADGVPAEGLLRRPLFAVASVVACVGAQIIFAILALRPEPPSVVLTVIAQALVLVELLMVASVCRWFGLSILVTLLLAATTGSWFERDMVTPELHRLAIVTVYYLILTFCPLFIGTRVFGSIYAYIGSVLAGVLYFFVARHYFTHLGWGDFIGFLPVAQAALMAALLMKLVRSGIELAEKKNHLALIAGTMLAFITAAIPLQLDKEWITIGYALQAAALAALYRKIDHRGLLFWSVGLIVTVFVRLTFNTEVLSYYPRSAYPILNWYLYTYFISAASMLVAGQIFRRLDDVLIERVRASAVAFVGGIILLFILLNIEIADYFSTGTTITFNFSAELAQDMTYTLGWTVFAIALLVAGILTKGKAMRLSSLLLLVVTVGKCFLHDLWRLGGLYRVASFVGLAVSLALVAIAIQKFILSKKESQS